MHERINDEHEFFEYDEFYVQRIVYICNIRSNRADSEKEIIKIGNSICTVFAVRIYNCDFVRIINNAYRTTGFAIGSAVIK